MHGKKGGKSPKVPKKSPAKGKRKLTRLSASNSNEDKPPAYEDTGNSTEEDINAYLDPMESQTNEGDNLEGETSDNTSDESSDDITVKDSSPGSILRKALESPRASEALKNIVVTKPPRGDVIVPLPAQYNPSPMKSLNIPSGVVRTIFPAEKPCGSSIFQPLGLEGLGHEEAEAVPDIAEIPSSLVSPGQRPRISPKKRQSPAAAESNIGDARKSPPTPSKIAKTCHFPAFGNVDSPCTEEAEFVMVTAVHQSEPALGNMATVLTPMTGVETRNVTFSKPLASRTSSAETEEATDQPDEKSRTPQQYSKLYIRAVQEDRFAHMAMNIAEKFRLIPDLQQQFLAECLVHMILAEALPGRLTSDHRVAASGCVHCAPEMKQEESKSMSD